MKVYDLDGTLSGVNNTFDFIKKYHDFNRAKKRLWFCEFTRRVMNRLPLADNFKRVTLIKLYFFGIKTKKLDNFFYKEYKQYFLNTLTSLGHEVLKQDNSKNIILTGCTEIPAKQISQLFNFSDCVCTEFSFYQNRVFGIKKDTYGDKKIKHIKSLLVEKGVDTSEVEYYTDDVKSEAKLVKIFKKTYVV